MRDDVTLFDGFGRSISFRGELLIDKDTDNGEKPQWTRIRVWRTDAGQYVLRRQVHYRVFHLSETCSKAAGSALVPASSRNDDFPCTLCNPGKLMTDGYGQESKQTIEVLRIPGQLIDSLATVNAQTGAMHHSAFAQSILAEISAKDEDVSALWMKQVVL